MGIFDGLAPRRRRPTAQPRTVTESFLITFIKAIGRALGGRFGRALQGPKRRRRPWWQR